MKGSRCASEDDKATQVRMAKRTTEKDVPHRVMAIAASVMAIAVVLPMIGQRASAWLLHAAYHSPCLFAKCMPTYDVAQECQKNQIDA
eukprot:2833628-Amphidinium_carterae.1